MPEVIVRPYKIDGQGELHDIPFEQHDTQECAERATCSACTLIYGASGTGKTSVCYVAVDQLAKQAGFHCRIRAIEIYMNNAEIVFDGRVNTYIEFCAAHEQIVNQRHTRCTTRNSTSSRSHLIWDINDQVIVDLAGSEEFNGPESRDINKSLTALNRCIKAMSKKKAHVPYRDHQLCWALRKHLSADSLLIATVDRRNEHDCRATLKTCEAFMGIKHVPYIDDPYDHMRREVNELYNLFVSV